MTKYCKSPEKGDEVNNVFPGWKDLKLNRTFNPAIKLLNCRLN